MSTAQEIATLKRHIQRNPFDPKPLEILFDYVLAESDVAVARELNREVRKMATGAVKAGGELSFDAVDRLNGLVKRTYLYGAKENLEDYLIFLEWNRKPSERFYLPRRRIMKRVIDNLQGFVDGTLDEMFVSMPTRVGKTTALMFFITWIIGRNPEASNLYSAYSDTITSALYSGVLEIINDPATYGWHDVFPTAKLVQTNAKDETLNIDRKKRYPSLTCRSLYGTLNGACDCNGLLVADDLIGGIEEALSPDRLASAWFKVDNNLMPRAKEQAKILWVGTRWAEADPAGLRMDLLANDDKFVGHRYEVINIPALDKNDESNFDYDYGVGYSTIYFHRRRASYERNNDMASWLAQYMGQPIERSGALFIPDDMLYYNGVLPPGEPNRIFMAVDPSWGGGDFVAAPICFDYDGTVYVHDVVYSDAEKNITRPLIVEKIKKYGIQAAHFEANKMTADYKDWIEEKLKTEGYRLNITNKAAPNDAAKEVRIVDRASEIREFYFLENGKRSKEYQTFMQNVFAFKIKGKNKNDDAPDSLAIVTDMIRGVGTNKVTVMSRAAMGI